ncbi:MAG: hypothetical protein J1E40_02395 [Oscillospiraceae bacterium]|nr:hypothetical protein [Oscillospiraceae bacterium]
MDEFVLIKAFSDDKQISERKLTLNEYYDGDCYEIDDKNYIAGNNISKVVILNDFTNEKAYNFYDNTGFPIKFITFTDGTVSRVEFCRKDNIFSWLDIEHTIESDIVNIALDYKLISLPKNMVIKGKMVQGDTCINELFSVKIIKKVKNISFENINIQNINKFEFLIEVIIDNNIVLQLR